MQLVLLTTDLMITSRVQGAAQKLNLQVHPARTPLEATRLCCATPAATILLVDLRLPGLDIAELTADARSTSPTELTILACAPHVHETHLAAARNAGCDHVITRGQLDREIDALLAEVVAAGQR